MGLISYLFGGDAVTKNAVRKPKIPPDDFPLEAHDKEVKTNKGETIAVAKNQPVAEDVTDRLNDQAYREEHDSWSA